MGVVLGFVILRSKGSYRQVVAEEFVLSAARSSLFEKRRKLAELVSYGGQAVLRMKDGHIQLLGRELQPSLSLHAGMPVGVVPKALATQPGVIVRAQPDGTTAAAVVHEGGVWTAAGGGPEVAAGGDTEAAGGLPVGAKGQLEDVGTFR